MRPSCRLTVGGSIVAGHHSYLFQLNMVNVVESFDMSLGSYDAGEIERTAVGRPAVPGYTGASMGKQPAWGWDDSPVDPESLLGHTSCQT